MAKQKKKNKSKKADLLLIEYQELCSNVRSFWNFRITILGFSITIIGVLFTHLIKPQFLQKMTLEICIMFLIFALIKTMVTLTRHLVVYSLRLKEIEEHFGPNSFWSRWGKYLNGDSKNASSENDNLKDNNSKKNNSKDSNSKTISAIIIILNIVVTIFILIINYIEFSKTSNTNIIRVLSFISLFIVLLSTYNLIQLNRYMNPKNHWQDIKDEWEKTSIP